MAIGRKGAQVFSHRQRNGPRLAEKIDGDPWSGLGEVLFNTTSTAHILGGCPMGADRRKA